MKIFGIVLIVLGALALAVSQVHPISVKTGADYMPETLRREVVNQGLLAARQLWFLFGLWGIGIGSILVAIRGAAETVSRALRRPAETPYVPLYVPQAIPAQAATTRPPVARRASPMTPEGLPVIRR